MPAGKRFVCIHGHFYQPPRENPWLETVETQDSAAPYHDWNERVCAECYAPNGAARVVNAKNQITRIVNNYARMSFNFGPTLLSWLRENAPRTVAMILDGENRSRQRYHTHSSAMAQVYNHMILPLANERDRHTQIRWGIADYESSFGVKPEGMWLPETAADTATLEALALNGIKFTSANGFAQSGTTKRSGLTRQTRAWSQRILTCSDSHRAHRLQCFSMTARIHARSHSRGCLIRATISRGG